jgi:NAD(P)H-dependent flavin oxidoreductase YrpB (nitropropane dioxygenase family)
MSEKLNKALKLGALATIAGAGTAGVLKQKKAFDESTTNKLALANKSAIAKRKNIEAREATAKADADAQKKVNNFKALQNNNIKSIENHPNLDSTFTNNVNVGLKSVKNGSKELTDDTVNFYKKLGKNLSEDGVVKAFKNLSSQNW